MQERPFDILLHNDSFQFLDLDGPEAPAQLLLIPAPSDCPAPRWDMAPQPALTPRFEESYLLVA